MADVEGREKTNILSFRPLEEWEKELNIRYHDVNPEWNYTISPRSTSKPKKGKK
ncbi:MAG: hypothetical protein DDT31_01415 [Syntrophomonadaceae bacterium]|nr:hypothetical protein [Bacillota bacterium]